MQQFASLEDRSHFWGLSLARAADAIKVVLDLGHSGGSRGTKTPILSSQHRIFTDPSQHNRLHWTGGKMTASCQEFEWRRTVFAFSRKRRQGWGKLAREGLVRGSGEAEKRKRGSFWGEMTKRRVFWVVAYVGAVVRILISYNEWWDGGNR